jgi:GxxExxY protein
MLKVAGIWGSGSSAIWGCGSSASSPSSNLWHQTRKHEARSFNPLAGCNWLAKVVLRFACMRRLSSYPRVRLEKRRRRSEPRRTTAFECRNSWRLKPFAKAEMSATCAHTEKDRTADCHIEANSIATRVIHIALKIHRRIGPGRLALAYAEALADTLGGDGLTIEAAEFIPVRLGGSRFNSCLRPPLIVGGAILVEPKCLASLSHIDRKQMLLLEAFQSLVRPRDQLRRPGPQWKHRAN